MTGVSAPTPVWTLWSPLGSTDRVGGSRCPGTAPGGGALPERAGRRALSRSKRSGGGSSGSGSRTRSGRGSWSWSCRCPGTAAEEVRAEPSRARTLRAAGPGGRTSRRCLGPAPHGDTALWGGTQQERLLPPVFLVLCRAELSDLVRDREGKYLLWCCHGPSLHGFTGRIWHWALPAAGPGDIPAAGDIPGNGRMCWLGPLLLLCPGNRAGPGFGALGNMKGDCGVART